MRMLVLGDVHLKGFAGNRTDDIFATQIGKLAQVYAVAKKHKITHIVQVGDLFNSPEVPNEVLSETIRFFFQFARADIQFFTILGQHDKYMRGGLEKSPTRILAEANLLIVLDRRGYTVYECHRGGSTTPYCFQGCHFGDAVPEPAGPNSILVIHQMIHPDKLYPQDEGFMTPRRFLSDHQGYRAILCGDHHGSFVYETKGRGIYNPGAMTRQTIADKDAFPQVFVLDVQPDRIDHQVVRLDCQADPFKPQVVNASNASGSLREMLGRLRQGSGSLSLERSAKAYFEREQIPQGVQNVIWAYLGT